MMDWKEYYVRSEQYEDQRREAARCRLLQEAAIAPAAFPSFVSPALAWLGSRLMEWGASLQMRYDSKELITPITAIHKERGTNAFSIE